MAHPEANPHQWHILLDENIPFRLKYDLRAAGFLTEHVTDVGLKGHADDVVYGHAGRNRLIVITNDRGFHPPYPQFPPTHAGILLSRLGNRPSLRSVLTAAVMAIAAQYETLDNRMLAIEPDGQIVVLR